MNVLHKGLSVKQFPGTTLRSVRRMENLQSAFRKINRRSVGSDGVPYEAFLYPRAYALWNPPFFEEFGTEPLKVIQERIAYQDWPDPTVLIPI